MKKTDPHSGLATSLSEADVSGIIAMAWQDDTPFEAIALQFGLTEPEIIALMRAQLKAKSFRVWRMRVRGRATKHLALQQGPGILAHHNRGFNRGHHRLGWPCCLHLATLEHNQVIGEAGQFIGRVGHVDHRDVQFIAQALQPRQDVLLACLIERGHGLIQQEHAGVCGQGAGNGHALPFATRQLRRLSLQQVCNAQQFNGCLQAFAGLRTA